MTEKPTLTEQALAEETASRSGTKSPIHNQLFMAVLARQLTDCDLGIKEAVYLARKTERNLVEELNSLPDYDLLRGTIYDQFEQEEDI